MINGVHALLPSQDADALRAFLSDVFGFRSVDAGGGWPIFQLPPAELAVHPSQVGGGCELYLMCDDIEATAEELRQKGIELTEPISDEGWGLLTSIGLPGGGELGLYEPRHPSPLFPS